MAAARDLALVTATSWGAATACHGSHPDLGLARFAAGGSAARPGILDPSAARRIWPWSSAGRALLVGSFAALVDRAAGRGGDRTANVAGPFAVCQSRDSAVLDASRFVHRHR